MEAQRSGSHGNLPTDAKAPFPFRERGLFSAAHMNMPVKPSGSSWETIHASRNMAAGTG